MPIELFFLDSYIRQVCERQQIANEALGIDSARTLRARLADIQAARNVADLTAGRPTPTDGTDRLALALCGPDLLVLEPANAPVPRDGDGAVQWVKVTKVRVVLVGKNND